MKSSLDRPTTRSFQHLGRLPGTCSLAVARRRARSIGHWQPLPNGGCNLPAASTFPLVADCSSAELNGDLWFFLFLITGRPCLPDFSEAQTRFLPRARFLLARRGPAPAWVPCEPCNVRAVYLFVFFIPRAKDSKAGPCGNSSDPGVLRPWGSGSSTQRGSGVREGGQFPRLAGTAGSSLSTPKGRVTRPSFLLRAASGTGSTCRDPGGQVTRTRKPSLAGSISHQGQCQNISQVH